VHRLDRETSGILLVAKKRSALLKLQDQFRDRETGKTYLALWWAHGPPTRRLSMCRCTSTCRPTASGG
jgi:23S rRNA pseudouridine955/2504/2580 synthase